MVSPLNSIGNFLGNLVNSIKDIYSKLLTSNSFLSGILNNFNNFFYLFRDKILEIIGFLGDIFTFFTDKFIELFGFFSDNFTMFIDFFVDKFNLFYDYLKDIFDTIVSLPSILIEKIKDLFLFLFIPDESFFRDNFDIVKSNLSNKLDVESYNFILTSLQDVTGNEFKDVEIEIMGVSGKIIDASVVNKSINSLHFLIRGAMYLFLVFYNYKMIYFLVRGTTFTNIGK